jgi:hypothetical protein
VLQSASEVKDAEIARLTAQIETLLKNDTALTDHSLVILEMQEKMSSDFGNAGEDVYDFEQ